MDTNQPLTYQPSNGRDEAVALIRTKLLDLYTKEPAAKAEANEIKDIDGHLSKYQKHMKELVNSGKPLVEIQRLWHQYYIGLTDDEKRLVWQEFYDTQAKVHQHYIKHGNFRQNEHPPAQRRAAEPKSIVSAENARLQDVMPQPKHIFHRRGSTKKIGELKRELLQTVNRRARKRLTARQNLKSLVFGLSIGSLVVLILLFGFFNERFIAPFVTPSRNVSATPIIVDQNTAKVGPNPEIFIPKINVEIPVVYDEPTIEEAKIQSALERGVIHYATTPNPGQLGNAVIFGHSSNNILNKGKYKFAFVLLSRLQENDVFYLQLGGIRYTYSVVSKKVVPPTDVSVLGTISGKAATATLITCDPPGTSLNRLIVVGEQISPDPVKNIASTVVNKAKPTVLASNSPTLWSRLTSIFH